MILHIRYLNPFQLTFHRLSPLIHPQLDCHAPFSIDCRGLFFLKLRELIIVLLKEFDHKQPTPEPVSPQEVLVYLMEEHHLKHADLVGKIGSKGVVS